MYQLNHIFLIILFSSILTSCNGQPPQERNSTLQHQTVGGAFENRELIYFAIPENINSTDTSPGWNQSGQKILLSGIVYLNDGKTPAPKVLLYYYHTNTEGRYLHVPEVNRSMPPNALGQTHGYIRGWVKTDSKGKYSIYTVRPGSYPNYEEPAHIHVTVKEPNGINEYYIDDFLFDDDKFLIAAKRMNLENRCGSGIVSLTDNEDLFVGGRNIILGLNIPDYPREVK